MSDRFAAMQWPFDGPCPTCGQRGDGVPVYAPTHTKALPDDVIERQLKFSDTRGPGGGPQ